MPTANPILMPHIRRMVAPGSEALTDAELVGRFAEHRDAAAFEVLVWRHGPMVWATCQRILRNLHDVEDAFQAVFLALARSAAALGARQAVGGWLHRVAMNAALKLKAGRTTAALVSEVAVRSEPDDGELAGVVDEELDRLPDRMRTAFVLCCLEGLTSAEAARELGCPVGTVDSRLHAARVRLRDRLTRRGFGPGVLSGLVATVLPTSTVTAAVKIGAGVAPRAAVTALADLVSRTATSGAIAMKIIVAATLAVAFVGAIWALGGSENAPLPPAAAAAPIPRDEAPGEGQIVLWREGHPIAFAPGRPGTTSLGKEFEGKRGSLHIGPDGKALIYASNRTSVRPGDPDKRDKVYLRDGKQIKEIDAGVSHCRAFWGADGVVYGHGLTLPKWGDPEPPVDLTTDFVNWSFDPRTGKTKALKLPGNVSVLDVAPDGKAFLVLHYAMPPGAAPGAPGLWADYRVGTLPVAGGEFVPLTELGESTPSDLRYSPDGKFVLGTMYKKLGGTLIPELVVFDLKDKSRGRVTVPKDAHVHASCWSPDGKRVAFVWEPEAAYTERNNRFGPVVPGQEKKPVYTVTVAKPDGSDAKDVYTETEYPYGSIDWSGIRVPGNPPPEGAEKPTADGVGVSNRGEDIVPVGGGTPLSIPRAVLYPDKAGQTHVVGRLTVNDHAMKQDTRVYSVGLEIDNLTGRAATLEFDPKDLKLELLDATGKVAEEAPTVRSGPAPIAHKATVPTSGYVGISTYRGGIGLTPKSILLAAGTQAWVVKPGVYRVRGTATVSVAFGGQVLDPEKPEAPESKPGNETHRLKLTLIECRFELKTEPNAPDR